jgi:hypothetical protein
METKKRHDRTSRPERIERKTYMSYHQDGLLDIFAGAYVLSFGLGVLLDIWESGFGVIMPAIRVAAVLPIWIAAKRKITMPRIGFVKFKSRNTNILAVTFLGIMVLGLVVFFVFTLAQGERPLWIELVLQNGLIVVGSAVLVACSLFGYSTGIKRLYIYGVATFILFAVAHFGGIFFAYVVLALGVAAIIMGFALLARFITKYPMHGDKTVAK